VLESEFSQRGVEDNALGRTREHVRQHNLSTILTTLHREGSLGRNILTQRTGLNRSTISSLVSELESLGLVEEVAATGQQGAGRPTLVVGIRDAVVAFAVAIDIDSIIVSVVGLSGRVLKTVSRRTPDAPAARTAIVMARDIISELRRDLPGGTRVAGVGVALPGQVSVSDGVVSEPAFLNWKQAPFAARLSEEVNLPVYVDNDARLGLVAEHDFGVGKPFSNIVYLVGHAVGIGGGVIEGGRPLRGSRGFAGELGHFRLSPPMTVPTTGFSGTLSATIQRDDLLEALGENILFDDRKLEKALTASTSSRVRRTVEGQIDRLGVAIAGLVNIFNPEAVLLAGFLGILFDLDKERLEAAVSKHVLEPSWASAQILRTQPGSDLLMIGTSELPLAPLLRDPSGFEFNRPVALAAVEKIDE
jgi:predicted NBD/HSP70 family sugar kinase